MGIGAISQLGDNQIGFLIAGSHDGNGIGTRNRRTLLASCRRDEALARNSGAIRRRF
jgi:hypothetical protein